MILLIQPDLKAIATSRHQPNPGEFVINLINLQFSHFPKSRALMLNTVKLPTASAFGYLF
jgi:hypothetical protein